MPNTRISNLTAATSVAGTDVYPSVQTAGVGPVKTSLTDITAFALANAPAGAVATPSIAPTGDTNTGFWFPAADTIAASTGGSERMRITSSGNVGIGVAAPDERLHVFGNISAGGTGANLGILLTAVLTGAIPSSSVKCQIASMSSGSGYIAGDLLLQPRTGVTASTIFATEGTERMRITSAGNVGIGTTSPADLLELSRSSANNVWMRVSNTSQTNQYITVNMCGSTAFSIPGWDNSGVIEVAANNVGSGTRGLVLSAFNGPIIFQTDTGRAERMRITSGGNVGIGTTPSATNRLSVNGAYDSATPSTSSPIIARLSNGGAISTWFGGSAYSYCWLQAIQDDGTNNLKNFVLQPLGGGVGIGGNSSGRFDVFNSSTLAFRVDTSGNIYGAAGTTAMTNGFFYMPAAAGAPSGTPSTVTGTVPFYYDTTNNQFYVYNGSWKKVTLA